MKKIRSILFLVIVFFTLQSCQTIKEGFTSQKKKSTDEFLVEKKSPLVMPPDFNELPLPKAPPNIIKREYFFSPSLLLSITRIINITTPMRKLKI